jgi:hypothetical protein
VGRLHEILPAAHYVHCASIEIPRKNGGFQTPQDVYSSGASTHPTRQRVRANTHPTRFSPVTPRLAWGWRKLDNSPDFDHAESMRGRQLPRTLPAVVSPRGGSTSPPTTLFGRVAVRYRKWADGISRWSLKASQGMRPIHDSRRVWGHWWTARPRVACGLFPGASAIEGNPDAFRQHAC